ncbi:hypothetical protein JW948_17705 [bacterium]|nr:hypothetical protein [bacterium]
MRQLILFALIITLGLTVTHCDKNPSEPAYQEEVMIFGYLWGNEPLDASHAISIKTTQPLSEAYDDARAAVRNAVVTLTDSASGEVWTLHDADAAPGMYYNDAIMIRPLNAYTLTVETENRTVTAVTRVPVELDLITELKTDSLNDAYQKNLGYEKPVYVECDCADDAVILVDMFCEEYWEDAEYINPFFGYEKPETREDYDMGVNGEPRHIQAILTYQDLVSPDFDNRHTVYWYASMIVYYGRNTMQITAIDENYTNYIFDEHPVYSGGVVNGLGLFASMCGSTYTLNIMKK